jgi:hypothetical protein
VAVLPLSLNHPGTPVHDTLACLQVSDRQVRLSSKAKHRAVITLFLDLRARTRFIVAASNLSRALSISPRSADQRGMVRTLALLALPALMDRKKNFCAKTVCRKSFILPRGGGGAPSPLLRRSRRALGTNTAPLTHVLHTCETCPTRPST